MNTHVSENQLKFLAENEDKTKTNRLFSLRVNDEWWFWPRTDWLTQIGNNEKIAAKINDLLKWLDTVESFYLPLCGNLRSRHKPSSCGSDQFYSDAANKSILPLPCSSLLQIKMVAALGVTLLKITDFSNRNLCKLCPYNNKQTSCHTVFSETHEMGETQQECLVTY